MGKAVFNKATGKFRTWERHAIPPHDTATEVVVDVKEPPKERDVKWKASSGLVNTTSAEKTAFDNAAKTEAVRGELNDNKIIKAIVMWIAPLVGKTPAEAKAEITTIYKKL